MKALDKTLVSCLAHDVLHLIVLPAEARSGRMEPRVVRGLKNLLTDRADELRNLTLSWFGGEPRQAHDVMEDVLRHVQILRAKHPAMQVRSDVTTGGQHLDRPALERLVALGADRFRISIDGPEDAVFPRIWDNLVSLRGVKGDFQVRVDANSTGRAVLDDEGCRAVLASLRAYARSRGVSRSAGHRRAWTRQDSLASSFVVRADGRVDRCTVFLGQPENRVGRLHESGRLELDETRDGGPYGAYEGDFQ